MAHLYSNVESPRGYFGYSSQLTNLILDLGATCDMAPEILDFKTGLLVQTVKYIEVADGNFIIAKKTGEVQIKTHDNNIKSFISALYTVLFYPDLWD